MSTRATPRAAREAHEPRGDAPHWVHGSVWRRQRLRFTRPSLSFFTGAILRAAMECENAARAADARQLLNAARVRPLLDHAVLPFLYMITSLLCDHCVCVAAASMVVIAVVQVALYAAVVAVP
jgi:hypothetical protein